MTCETYRELIAAHVDGHLKPAEGQEAERHLADCPACARLFADQKQFRQISRSWHWEESVPLNVEHRLRVALETENSPVQRWWHVIQTQLASLLQPVNGALAVVALAVLIMAILPKTQIQPLQEQARAPKQAIAKPAVPEHATPTMPEQAVIEAATSYYKAVRTGELPLAYATNNPRELEEALKASERLDFSLYVPDLRPAGYELNGGIVVNINGKPAVITVYQGAEGQIVCLRQSGRMPSPPAGARRLREQEYLYAKSGQTALYKQLPDQFRVIVSGLSPETFLSY